MKELLQKGVWQTYMKWTVGKKHTIPYNWTEDDLNIGIFTKKGSPLGIFIVSAMIWFSLTFYTSFRRFCLFKTKIWIPSTFTKLKLKTMWMYPTNIDLSWHWNKKAERIHISDFNRQDIVKLILNFRITSKLTKKTNKKKTLVLAVYFQTFCLHYQTSYLGLRRLKINRAWTIHRMMFAWNAFRVSVCINTY